MSLSNRRRFLGAALACAAAPTVFARSKRTPPDKNVLFIAVDDLRPDLRCYGNPDVVSPHIDRLASRGLTFLRHYCQEAVCNPSRQSMLTGLRPDTIGVNDLQTHFRRSRPSAPTLPQHFKDHGYATTAFGKVFHKPALNDLPSWSIAPWIDRSEEWGGDANSREVENRWARLRAGGFRSDDSFYFEPEKREPRPPGGGWGLPSWEAPDVADDELTDGRTARAAVDALHRLKNDRFFLAVGLLKPHLPFVAPKRYYDLYPRAYIRASEAGPPLGAPLPALHGSAELRGYSDIPAEGKIPEEQARDLIRAYYASISYADAQVGVLLDALAETGLDRNTTVVLWSDHGYHLGELDLWNKHTNFENATRAPLIVSYPGQRAVGRKTAGLTESVDLFPSLCDICNVPMPSGLEGAAFTPLFENPDRLWKRAVFSQYPREIPGIGPGMGYSMRTNRYRYTEWTAEASPYKSLELYDYKQGALEQRNIAARPENQSLVNGLSGILQEGWRGSLPPTDPRSGAST